MKTLVLSDQTYRVESELGSGGGGIVYKAWHTRLQKYVVIKELKGGSASDTETQRNEVEALKNVKSAFLPQVFDFLSENGRIFTVIEFVEGESLDKLLERGQKFTQPQVVKWYDQLVSALEAIHKQNVCHRDIKPANIMLTPGGDVCLIDFNAALVSGNDARLISRSLGYASPEQYEIYERFKNTRNAPINYGSSSVSVNSPGGTATEVIADGDATEAVDGDSGLTERLMEDRYTQNTELLASPAIGGVDWKRSDIYSLGATMYHLLTGTRPPERAAEVVAVSKLGRFSEGLVYILEQSMKLAPAERFPSVTFLADAVRNIHKHDSRWKLSQSKKIAAAIILPLTFALFAGTAFFGRNVMAQEKEERYYAAVYRIEQGADADTAYEEALSMFWDRIDPYRAMAERLWNDGDPAQCREYIESNLGNIAEFQDTEESRSKFGDIYYILGSCLFEAEDYQAAQGNFAIALQYVRDNPVIYRDYAIALARSGRIGEAEQVLDTARELRLQDDSLNLLYGEISLSRQEYDAALAEFRQVVDLTGDDYLRYRAYHSMDRIYRLTNQPRLSADLLIEALPKIPLNRKNEMTERLADAYARSGDNAKAATCFEELIAAGYAPFHIRQNLAIIYQNMGALNQAGDILAGMVSDFPEDYRIPMRQAFVEAARQSGISNASRNYSRMKQYYDAAVRLYQANVKPGESDPEMQMLDTLIDELRRNNWLD
ncbi:MAG: protein kinase [Gracilibacteraceae bacterium]|jgi:serine/threonine-protein kinase|nr:protein kinase [Gracilibacteraceae bacterium]